MSSRPQLKPYAVFLNQSMASSTATSRVTIITNMTKLGYDIAWSGGDGSTAGTFSVQVSNSYSQDASGQVLNAGNWTTLTLSSTPTVAAASGNGFIEIDSLGAYAVRLVYTRTGGAGTMTAYITGKVA